MKKVLTITLAFSLFIACMFASYTMASSGIVLSVAAGEIVDSQFTATVKLSTNPGIAGLKLVLSYDSAKLKLENISKNSDFQGATTNSDTPGKIGYVTYSGDSNFQTTGVLFTAQFSIIKGNWTETDLTITCSPDDVTDENFDLIPIASITNTTVTQPAVSHTHTPTADWLHDEIQHWHGCTVEGCDAKLDAAAHVFDKSKAEIVVAPTETTHGKLAVSCEVCGYEAFGVVHHCYVEDWLHDETQHWHVCTVEGCDAKMGVEAHTWDNGVVTTQPTETGAGVKTFTCTACKRTRTEGIPATGTDSPSTPSTGSGIHVVTPDAPNLVEPAPLPPQTGAPMNSLAFCLLFLASAASYCFAKRMQKVS